MIIFLIIGSRKYEPDEQLNNLWITDYSYHIEETKVKEKSVFY